MPQKITKEKSPSPPTQKAAKPGEAKGNPLLRKDFAERLGVSTRKISEYWTRGMTRVSLDEAQEWYNANIDHRCKTTAHKSADLVKAGHDVEVLSSVQDAMKAELASPANSPPPTVPGVIVDLTLPEQLKTMKTEAGWLKTMLVSTRSQPHLYAIYKKLFDDTVKQTLEIEKQIVKIQSEASQVISIEELEEALTAVTRDISNALDRIVPRTLKSLPKAIKPKVKAALQAEVDKTKNYFHDFANNQSSI